MERWTAFCIAAFLFISGFLTRGYVSKSKEIIIPIRNEIEQAIKVMSTDNVVVKTEHIGLGGGLGVGVGAAQIVCQSKEQFLDFVPKGEEIYVSLKIAEDKKSLTKTFLSFIKNKAGVVVYEDKYFLPEKISDFYEIENYNWEKAVFRKQSEQLFLEIFGTGIGVFVLWLILSIVGSFLWA